MIGALIASAAVYSMAKIGNHGQIKPVTLLLSGTAVNAVMSAITSLLIFLAKSQESIAAVYNWQMGSIAAAQWSTLFEISSDRCFSWHCVLYTFRQKVKSFNDGG